MKKLLTAFLACFTAASALFAQTLNVTAPGYSGVKLFDSTAGYIITGMGVAPAGDIFYIETHSAVAAPSTLFRRSPADGYFTATPLFHFGSAVFGSFVVCEGEKVMFGESSTGEIRAVNADLSIDSLGTVGGNYDAAFAPGGLFLSHNPGGLAAQNKVSRFDLLPDGGGGLMLSAPDLILDTPDDYSGPVEFDGDGNLFYGGSFARGDLYRFSSAEVAAASGNGPAVTLDSAHRYLANGPNGYLAFNGTDAFWQSDFTQIDLIDATHPTATVIATSSDGIGHLDRIDQVLLVNVTRSTFDGSAVYAVVPEPSAMLLGAAGLGVLAFCRRVRC